MNLGILHPYGTTPMSMGHVGYIRTAKKDTSNNTTGVAVNSCLMFTSCSKGTLGEYKHKLIPFSYVKALSEAFKGVAHLSSRLCTKLPLTGVSDR